MQSIFITLINYNGRKNTLDCLKSLDKLIINDFILSVVVIDNGSDDLFKTEQNLYKNFKLKIIRSEKNLGFSGGQNLGIKYALNENADFVIVLNNDVIVEESLVLELLKTFKEKSDCGMVSPKIYFAKGHEFHKDRYKDEEKGSVIWYAGGVIDWKNLIAKHRGVDEVDSGQYEKLETTDFVSGCCMMIKKEVLEKIGIFDDKYFLYYEDNDLGQRAKNRNFELYYQPKSILWHINAGSAGGSGSALQDYYISRNRLLFGTKYAPLRTKISLLRESLVIILSGRKWQKRGIVDFYLGRFGRGSYE